MIQQKSPQYIDNLLEVKHKTGRIGTATPTKGKGVRITTSKTATKAQELMTCPGRIAMGQLQ